MKLESPSKTPHFSGFHTRVWPGIARFLGDPGHFSRPGLLGDRDFQSSKSIFLSTLTMSKVFSHSSAGRTLFETSEKALYQGQTLSKCSHISLDHYFSCRIPAVLKFAKKINRFILLGKLWVENKKVACFRECIDFFHLLFMIRCTT
jgi:hypothetical protein